MHLVLYIGLSISLLVANLSSASVPKSLNKELVALWGTAEVELVARPDLDQLIVNDGHFYWAKHGTEVLGTIYIGRVNTCRAGGCSAQNTQQSLGGSEYFEAFFIYNNLNTLMAVKVFNYQATHGHGICSRGWLKQFIGYDGQKCMEVGKDIDSISGATISVHAMTNEINYITNLLNNNNTVLK